MRENRVKKVMSDGGLALGTYVTFADPQVVEIIGLAGYDAAFIDMEHTTFDLNLITEMIRAADLVGITSVIRVPDNDEKLILRLLDAGAEGIIVPHVDGLEGAKRAVDAVRYGPQGHRGGAGGTRATRYGTISWEDHIEQSNREILLSVMTEDDAGIQDIEAIADLDGIDLVSIGPTDFSEYMGIRDPSSPVLREKIGELAAKIRGIGKAKMQFPMNHAALPMGPQELLDLGVGYTHVSPPPTAVLLKSLRDRLTSIRQEIG